MTIDLDDLKRARPDNVRRLARALGLRGSGDIDRVRVEVLRKIARTQPAPRADSRWWFL
jgi:hypothetical protein